jgi:hypothetical protein
VPSDVFFVLYRIQYLWVVIWGDSLTRDMLLLFLHARIAMVG